MKKDRISLLILVFEIAGIVAMHATRQKAIEITNKPADHIRPTPVFSTTTLPSNNMVHFMNGYSHK
jgi:hypothetical protein